MGKLYHVGIYCRLSVDDANNSAKASRYLPADESVSIENQREMLSKFVMINGWIETKTYVDDGFSGGNFQRPGFQEMLEDARNGVINLILVKDLSRLGRDFVEVGRYTSDVFPSLGVRFVSLLDCLDTEGDNTDMLHFRSLMNDYHLRDMSGKIKSVLRSKKADGQFTSAYAPYGYRKSDEDKHRLVVDEYAAGVVRRIFAMRLSGMAYGKIAAALNREGILSPRAYWYQSNHKDNGGAALVWKDTVVKKMLRNEVYCGTLLMNHSGTRSYKDKTRISKPESEWIRHEAEHEAIVSPETWRAVQDMNREVRLRYLDRRTPAEKLFTGKLICADCKHRLVSGTETQRRKDGSVKRYVSYHCGLHGRTGGSLCSRHTIYEMTLARIVTGEIQAQAKAVTVDENAVMEKIKRKLSLHDDQRLKDMRKEAAALRRRVGELEELTARLYEDKINGVISQDAFTVLIQKNEQERLSKTERLDTLLPEIQEAERREAAIREWTVNIGKYLSFQELNREIVDQLIDHIEIGERTLADGHYRQSVKIFYRFVGQLD